MTHTALETQLSEIERVSSIPAIEAMNQYMLTLSNDFPIRQFFKQNTIKQVVTLDPIFVIHSPNSSKYECISGIRAVSTLRAYNMPSCMVNIVQEYTTQDILQLAIRNNILPLVYWPVALSSKTKCFKFIDGLRKHLPAEHRNLAPSTASLKKAMGLKSSEGRIGSRKKSELETFLESFS